MLVKFVICLSDFEGRRLNDSLFDSLSGTSNKAFLKSRLLENLNNFFPSVEPAEQLEMLNKPSQQATPDTDPLVTELPSFPTLLPREPDSDPNVELEMATAPSTKIRSEGRIPTDRLDTVRSWRKRLYKAFKNRSRASQRIIKSPEVEDLTDTSPIIVDKNRQFLMARPNWQSARENVHTYGRDPNGKLIPLYELEVPKSSSSGIPGQSIIEPYPPKEIRYAYRTPQGQHVVYVPSAPTRSQETIPVPVASYLVTTKPQQPIQLQIVPEQKPLQAPPLSYFATSTQMPYSTFAPIEINDAPQKQNNCGSCGGDVNEIPIGNDEKCNSLRLRTIIMNNIVINDAEASKRAVQSSAEAETGQYFDAICGTGFFSYIAHTDEFCLASSGGVNCYVFSPICSQDSMMKTRRRVFLNKN
ncbi:unnamed protein product [Caenorhabditis bovis]|uniref:Ground-like domain-containing protein n=1 Tax=Caenorhabditis bovis TaxID=2654633 RepID=A0A8S1E1M9_9PELO|nr:unnamed protein product [Caenorhabditis bovis]